MKNLQNGRSMIEMLGVLAIIGVLSIGGLAGYTMAMNRHRANSALDYGAKAFVVAQTRGDGSLEIASTNCTEATVLDQALPSGLTGCTVARAAGGATTVTLTFASATDSVSKAFANRAGIANAAASYTMTDTGANANKWVADE